MAKTTFEYFQEYLVKGNLDELRKNFKTQFLEIVVDNNYSNCKPIHIASKYGHISIVKFLISKKCNIEIEDNDKWTPIHYACWNGHIEIVKCLLNQRCNIECEDEFKWKPIHCASWNGHINILKLLIEYNCQIESRTNIEQSALDLAKSNGHKEIVILIEESMRVKNEMSQFNFSIRDSIMTNDDQMLAKFYKPGILASTDLSSGQSWLEIAFDNKAYKIINYFLVRPIDDSEISYLRNMKKKNFNSLNSQLWQEVLLYKCIRDHHEEGFELICCAEVINGDRKIIPYSFLEVASENGSCVFLHEILRKSIFDSVAWEKAKKIALMKNYHKIYDSILDREYLLKCRQRARFSILHTAVCDNDPDMVRYILNKGIVDPNQIYENLGTAFAMSIMLCNEKCMTVLERFNIDYSIQNKYFQGPLHEAICNEMIDHCKYLIDCTQNIDQSGFMGQTALHSAVIKGCEELCEQLVKKGADCTRYMEFYQYSSQDKDTPNLKDPFSISKKENSLTLCVKLNKTIYSCFLELLDRNKANSSDSEEYSLLHFAVKLLNHSLCDTLIKAGGDVNSVNKKGNTPLFELLSSLDQQTFDDNYEKILDLVNLFVKSHLDVNKLFQRNFTIFKVASNLNCERLLLALLPTKKESILDIDLGYLFRISFEKKYFQFCEALLNSCTKDQCEYYIGTEIINMTFLQENKNLSKSLIMHPNFNIKKSVVENLLYHLAKLNDSESFEYLLNEKIINPELLESGETLLTGLLKEKKFNFCQSIFLSEINNKRYNNLKNQKNQIPLQVAIESESMDSVQYLIFETENLDNEDFEGNTALVQLFRKISNDIDKERSLCLLNAIKAIIIGGGNIYHKTKNLEDIEYCSHQGIKKEIERLFKIKHDKTLHS